MTDSLNKEAAKLHQIADANEEVLSTASSMFPFEFFPTSIVVTKAKVDIINTLFFFSKHIQSVLISEIGRVEVVTSLFFSELIIRAKTVDKVLIAVKFLPTKKALEMQSILQGLLVSTAEKVDVQAIPSKQLKKDARAAGRPLAEAAP